MKAQQPIDTTDVNEVASLLIPMQGKQLLVPNVSVAEIVPVGEIEPVSDAPDWYLGDYIWRDLTIPLVSFEVLNGDDRPAVGEGSRVAVFNTTGVSDAIHFTAMLAQGLPRLARVTPEELQSEDDELLKRPFEQVPVRWAGEEAVIPDVPAIEKRVLEYLKTRA